MGRGCITSPFLFSFDLQATDQPPIQLMLRHLTSSALLALLFLSAGTSAQQAAQTVRLTAGVHLITAELAANDPMRTRGLMFRESLAANHGMLFVFDSKAVHCMWMRNTLLPLSVAFLDDDGRIVNIE